MHVRECSLPMIVNRVLQLRVTDEDEAASGDRGPANEHVIIQVCELVAS